MTPKLISFDGRALGWKRDSLDTRDFHFRRIEGPRHLPSQVDLRPDCVPHMDQLTLGSCVAHGVTACLRYTLMKEGVKDRPLSRLQSYYDGRVVENTVKVDSGLEIRDAIKCAADLGVAVEPLWPYNIDRFRQKPFQRVYDNALKFRALTYKRVSPDASSIKAAIASGWPVVFGCNVFNQFLSDQCARDGVVAMPRSTDAPVGGHCLYAVGYGQKLGYITVRNSWGSNWGSQGDCFFPEEYMEQQASDFWIITKVGLQ
jgi:C1A family cysteine protease